MRLIDADVLFENVGKIKPRNKEHYESIGEFMNMITNTPTINVKWIPVSEGLPDYRHTVLISTKWGVNIASRDSINEGVTDDFWDCPLDDSTMATRYVTAWMPLSEPNKEEKSSDL